MKTFKSAIHFYPKTLLSTLVSLGILMSAGQSQAAVSQAPLNLVEGVAPNMLFTLDESGSMSWPFVPDQNTEAAALLWGKKNSDNKHWGETESNSGLVERGYLTSNRFHANRTNPMAYNPHIIYEIPPAFNEDGTEKELSTQFTKAPLNGFLAANEEIIIEQNTDRRGKKLESIDNTRNGTNPWVDLSKNYPITEEHRIPKTAPKIDYWTNPWQPAYYYVFDPNLKNHNNVSCATAKDDKYKGGEDCYKKVAVTTEKVKDAQGNILLNEKGDDVTHQKNYAIWFSFYRTRALATMSAASIAFKDLSSSIRFSWQNLKTCKKFDGTDTTNCKNNQFQPYSSKHRAQFYSWLRSVYFNVGTPLPDAMVRAGEFYTKDAPWRNNPTDTKEKITKENTISCRPSYHILMTDGMWNTDLGETMSNSNGLNTGKWDHATFNTPKGKLFDSQAYPKSKPFYDSTGSENYKTLADIAMHYWASDLRTDIDNNVPSFMPRKDSETPYWDPRNNPAEWQHMSNFIMGLGLTNAMTADGLPWEGQTHTGAGYANLLTSKTWPAASASSDNNVYDLWHAAINSRGEFYSVDSPEDMVLAFKDIMNRIAERTTTAALPAISSSVEDIDDEDAASGKLISYFYQTGFDSTNWSGELIKKKRHVFFDNLGKRHENITEVWNAAKLLDKRAHTDRKIYTVDKSGNLIEFTSSKTGSFPDKLTATLNKNGYITERINFLRGDRSNEDKKLSNQVTFGIRDSVMGDLLNSRPILVRGARMLQSFAKKTEPSELNQTYAQFSDSIQNRIPHIYVGGNDGMLHAFNAETGKETFAFIPSAVHENLRKLIDKDERIGHQFYVDGTPVIGDVYDGTKWRTILVGTLGAGGQGIFALDVTDPTQPKLLWELNAGSAQLKNKVQLGHSFSRPTIARLHNGEWAVVTGNGYVNGDNSGKAALYVINAINGTTKSLEVQSPIKRANGLSTPKLVDYDNDGVADYAYAGDLHGNLWRFDLLGSNAGVGNTTSIYGDRTGGDSGFQVSYGGSPMFSTSNTQQVENNIRDKAITAAPTIIRHPQGKGYLVTFGTGRYFEDFDKGGSNFLESVYAIWDEKTNAEATTATTITADKLLKQKFNSNLTANDLLDTSNKPEARTISNNIINWSNHKGWQLDLGTSSTATGEMMINDMMALGSTLLFSTSSPSADPCAAGSGTWIYAINAHSGGRTEKHIFVDIRDSAPNSEANVISGIKMPGDTASGIAPSRAEDLGGQTLELNGYRIRPERSGRQTWRLVPDP